MENLKPKKINEEQDKVKEVCESLDYMNWLENFTEKTTLFTSNQYINYPNCFNEDLAEKINNIEYLYIATERFAKNNYVEPTKLSLGDYYVIEYNGNKYRLGYGEGNDRYYFCERLVTDTNEKAIKIEHIIYNIPLENTLLINNLLYSLKNNVKSLDVLGVNEDDIIDIVKEALIDKPKTRKRVK